MSSPQIVLPLEQYKLMVARWNCSSQRLWVSGRLQQLHNACCKAMCIDHPCSGVDPARAFLIYSASSWHGYSLCNATTSGYHPPPHVSLDLCPTTNLQASPASWYCLVEGWQQVDCCDSGVGWQGTGQSGTGSSLLGRAFKKGVNNTLQRLYPGNQTLVVAQSICNRHMLLREDSPFLKFTCRVHNYAKCK